MPNTTVFDAYFQIFCEDFLKIDLVSSYAEHLVSFSVMQPALLHNKNQSRLFLARKKKEATGILFKWACLALHAVSR